MSERELRRDGVQTVRDRRRGHLLSGTPHAPDGVLLVPGGSPGGGAIEVELSRKKQLEYERILRWYGAPDYRHVAWFVSTKALWERFTDLIADERLSDLMNVRPLPTGAEVARWG